MTYTGGIHQQTTVKYCKNIEKTRTFRVCLVSVKIGLINEEAISTDRLHMLANMALA